VITICFILIGLILAASIVSNNFLIGVALVGVPGILFLLAGSPIRVLMVVFAVQIIFSVSQLDTLNIIPYLRTDDILTLWLILLWLLSLPDRSMREIRIGLQGKFILFFLAVFGISVIRGFTAGQDLPALTIQMKTYGAYLCYFPLLWILSDERSFPRIWKILLSSAVIGGILFLVMGYTGYGENVMIRRTTGLRIATRQPNAFAVILMMFLGMLWKNWKKRPPFIVIIPSIIMMGIGIILSQTRGIWGGVILAFAAAWILNLFRKKDNVKLARKLIVSLTTVAVLVILIVISISTLGILSASNIARRTGTESGNYLTDVSTLSRFIAWSAVVDDLNGSGIVFGNGLADEYTCFRPDIGSVVTVFYVDSSYFQVALNMGLVGVVVFFAIFVITLVRAAGLFLRTNSRQRAGIALGIFCSVIMLLFAGGFAAILTNYRFTILWVFLPALLQIEIMRDRKEDSLLLDTLQDR